MELKPGAKLGPYEIVSAIGKGGMGEAWKARDPRLGREVAIKVSSQQLTDRFEREQRAIAALNHSNICTLYDVGPNYLVMEFVAGPTLAERIAPNGKPGPIPLEEALGIAKQIADALEAAHEKGIVHRDLKPANVKIRPDGSVKVLDFGLAKSAEYAEVTADLPTMMSVPGTILGTAGYMSPEQARGKEVDKRADIWAFGVVLYEMVTGKRLFEGETVSDTLAAIQTGEPGLRLAPARARPLLQRCLEKDPKRRLRDICDAIPLLDMPEPVHAASAASRTPWIAPTAALNDRVRAGKVRYIGASAMFAWQFMKMLMTAGKLCLTRFVSMQNYCNLLHGEEEREMLPLCRAEGIRVIPFSPLARGFVAGNRRKEEYGETVRAKTDEFSRRQYYGPQDFAIVDRITEVAQKRGVNNAQIALAWVLQQPGVTAPIVGASKMSHLDEAVAALSIRLDEAELKLLAEHYRPRQIMAHT